MPASKAQQEKISNKIRKLLKEGKKKKQSVAMALSMARRKKL